MLNELALMMVMMWPIVPMFLIELHLATAFWRKMGLWTYLAVLLQWLPIGFVLYYYREPILSSEATLGTAPLVVGVLLIAAGVVLHAWTAKILGIKATIGYTELRPNVQPHKQDVITSGPFSVVRHPSYWAHTAIFAGVFLITGVVAVGIIALIDFAITYFVVTKLEDRELVERFGDRYVKYKRVVPRFFPRLTKNQVALHKLVH